MGTVPVHSLQLSFLPEIPSLSNLQPGEDTHQENASRAGRSLASVDAHSDIATAYSKKIWFEPTEFTQICRHQTALNPGLWEEVYKNSFQVLPHHTDIPPISITGRWFKPLSPLSVLHFFFLEVGMKPRHPHLPRKKKKILLFMETYFLIYSTKSNLLFLLSQKDTWHFNPAVHDIHTYTGSTSDSRNCFSP